MKKSNDSGHVKNSAQFNEAVEFVSNIGTDYNPSNLQIQLLTLQAKGISLNTILDKLAKAEPVLKDAIYNRQNIYNNLDLYTAKAYNALCSSDVDYKFLSEAKSISKKILGSSKPKKKGEPPPEETEIILNSVIESEIVVNPEEETNRKSRSTSQRGFDKRINNFSKFCYLLSNVPEYNPNEPELKISELNLFKVKVSESNILAIKASNAMDDARLERDIQFYTGKDNAYETFKKVKSYIKSVYGTSSPKSKAISKLSFKLLKMN